MANKKLSFKMKFMLFFWGTILTLTMVVTLLFFGVTRGWVGYLPPLEELQNPKNRYASEIYSEDLVSLGRYYEKENRVGVQYEDLNEKIVHALVATEDARFYEHSGVDFKALTRAVLKMGRAGGGSTLTQQLAKQLWSPRAGNVFQRALQKPIEWVIAVQLERLYSKDEILLMYLNQFDFLNNAVGIQSAAQVYFGKTPVELNTEECAMLVGLCQNPTKYNPRRHVDRCRTRRNIVLGQMAKYGYISSQECDSLSQLPITLNYHKVDHKEGLAPYFREMLRRELTRPNGILSQLHKPDGSSYNLYQDGLRIYTTIDSRMQKHAEEAVAEHMQELQTTFFREKRRSKTAPFSRDLTATEVNTIMHRTMRQTDRYRSMRRAGASEEEIETAFNTPVEMQVFTYSGMKDTVMSPMDSIRWNKFFLRCGFMAIEPHTGHVKAYIGGPNFSQFQYDMVHVGRRQVGSTVKPYLYTLAMENGMWPCDQTVNDSVTFTLPDGKLWTPRDDHDKNRGEMVTLSWGLERSSNWISAYLMKLFGPQPMADLMRSFGIRGEIDPVYALCLGPCEVSVEEMADAYTTFVNRGIRTEPLFITRIEDKNGNILVNFTPKTHEVINPITSYKMISMLRGVVDRGTGIRLRAKYQLKMPLGGKTGTTQNNSDGWFVGFSPAIVAATWVGGEDRSIHFDNMANGQGSAMALPIFGLFMQKVYADPLLGFDVNQQFDIPDWFDVEAGCK